MSLINDALKKAQRERSLPVDTSAPRAPGTPTPPPPAAPRTALQAKSNPWPALLVVLALVGGGTAVWFLKPSPAASVTVAANTPSTVAEPAPVPTTPEPPPPELKINLAGPASPETTAPTPSAPQPPSPAPVAVAPTPAPVAPVAAPATPSGPLQITLQLEDPRILAFLDAAKINGIRAAADDAKLLMNNKVFRVGGVVDRELGLKLVQILPTELVFEDARGIQYRKLL